MGPKFFGTSKGHAFLSNIQYKLNSYKIDFEDYLKSFRGPRLAHGLFDVVVYAMLYKKNTKSTALEPKAAQKMLVKLSLDMKRSTLR